MTEAVLVSCGMGDTSTLIEIIVRRRMVFSAIVEGSVAILAKEIPIIVIHR